MTVDNEKFNKWAAKFDGNLDNTLLVSSDSDTTFARYYRDSGKPIPYVGWFWRSVDFNHPISLGIVPDTPFGELVGFMENNKWDYGWVDLTQEQQATLIAKFSTAVENTCETTLQGLFDFIQSCGKKS